jgi:hypothetical protein
MLKELTETLQYFLQLHQRVVAVEAEPMERLLLLEILVGLAVEAQAGLAVAKQVVLALSVKVTMEGRYNQATKVAAAVVERVP